MDPMDIFQSAFEDTMFDEAGRDPDGAYHNDPHDPGGETKWGFCKRWNPDVDIKNLTKQGARELALKNFWLKPGFDKITNVHLASKLFNIGFNLSPTDAIKFLQDAANKLGANLTVDGLLGPSTVKWINNYKYAGALLMGLKINAGRHYFEHSDAYNMSGLLLRLAE